MKKLLGWLERQSQLELYILLLGGRDRQQLLQRLRHLYRTRFIRQFLVHLRARRRLHSLSSAYVQQELAGGAGIPAPRSLFVCKLSVHC